MHLTYLSSLYMTFLKTLLVLTILLLAGCEKNEQVNAQTGTPEYIAGEFFHAIYNVKDLDTAKKLCTKEYADLLASYGSARQVGRTLLNMNFDTVTINVNRSGRNLRQQYDNEATIQLIFDGEFDSKRIQDTRTVELVKQRGSWRIKKVQADRFSSAIR